MARTLAVDVCLDGEWFGPGHGNAVVDDETAAAIGNESVFDPHGDHPDTPDDEPADGEEPDGQAARPGRRRKPTNNT